MDERVEGCRASGSRALNAAGQLAEAALGARPLPSAPATVEDARRLSAERLEAMARHELVEFERAAQDEAVAARAARLL